MSDKVLTGDRKAIAIDPSYISKSGKNTPWIGYFWSGATGQAKRGLEILGVDNNLAENSLRGLALGRKNYLFCGNHDAAEDAAVIYSLLGCCKAADVNFRDWMVYVLGHIHDYDEDYTLDLAELLPGNYSKRNS